jgi:hypothetical protein
MSTDTIVSVVNVIDAKFADSASFRRCLVLTELPSRDGSPSGETTFRTRLSGKLHELASCQSSMSSFYVCRFWKHSIVPKTPARTGGISCDSCRRLPSQAVG